MSKNRLPSNWRDRIEYVVESEEDGRLEMSCQFIRGKTPRGFFSRIGVVVIDDGWLESLEIFDDRMKRRGIGTKLLTIMLIQYGSVSISWSGASFEGKPFYKWFAERIAGDYRTDFFKEKLVVVRIGRQTTGKELPSVELKRNIIYRRR